MDTALILLYWWSEIITAVRRYRIGYVTAVEADLALASARSRIEATQARDRRIDDLPSRFERAGTGVMTAAITVAALAIMHFTTQRR